MEIRLRKFNLSDKEELAKLANNKKIWLNLRDAFPHPYTVKDAKWFINFTKDMSTKVIFAIKYNDNLAGSIGIFKQDDVYKYNAEIGYWIAEPYWNKGIASKAIKLATEFAFTNFNVKRIFASTFETNLASARVLEKNNFIFEGVSKKSVFKNNKFLDEHRFALLKNEK